MLPAELKEVKRTCLSQIKSLLSGLQALDHDDTVRRAAAMQLGTGLPSCSVRGGVALLPESTLFCGAEREVGPEELEL